MFLGHIVNMSTRYAALRYCPFAAKVNEQWATGLIENIVQHVSL